ncbi:hypothetical protein [Bacillus pseudomycoides]|nr:hypothetical protein [Bacillus pseudomycoides]
MADLVILNNSILSVNPNQIKDLKVETTIIDGEIIYQEEQSVKI